MAFELTWSLRFSERNAGPPSIFTAAGNDLLVVASIRRVKTFPEAFAY
jgi:hypothetical protein